MINIKVSKSFKSTTLYILKRIGLMLITFFIITSILFILVRTLVPPDVAYGPEKEIEEARLNELGYNKPILEQLFIFYKNIFTKWDFGVSLKLSYLTPANQLFFESLPPTLLVNLYAVILIIPLGILYGVFVAKHKNRPIDIISNIFMMLLISLPSFAFAFLLQYLLCYKAGLPTITSSLFNAGGSYFTFKMFVSHIVPVLALAIPGIFSLARFVRAEMIDSLGSENVAFARSLGVPKRKVIYHYAFKGALVPLLPMLFGLIIGIFTGSIIIEQVFSIPGVGRLMLQAINELDYDVFMTCSMFYTFLGLLSSLVIDITYSLVDPRIRIGGNSHNVR